MPPVSLTGNDGVGGRKGPLLEKREKWGTRFSLLPLWTARPATLPLLFPAPQTGCALNYIRQLDYIGVAEAEVLISQVALRGQCNENNILLNFPQVRGQVLDLDKLDGPILEEFLEEPPGLKIGAAAGIDLAKHKYGIPSGSLMGEPWHCTLRNGSAISRKKR